MTYIYDVLLNFTEDERVYEFFEWEKDDEVEHIKRIPLYRVSTKSLEEILTHNIILNIDFLEEIKDKTLSYKKNINLEYAMLVTDLNKIIALEFNNKGKIIARSNLLLDEEEEIIEEAYDVLEEKIIYTLDNKIKRTSFLTRKEEKQQKYLIQEINYLYKEKLYDKLNFLYNELYTKDNIPIDKKYEILIQDLTNNYNYKHNNLYEIVRLTYTKKQTN